MKKKWKILSIITLLTGTIVSASATTKATSDYEENMEPVIWSDESYQAFETGQAETFEMDNPILQGQCGDRLYYMLDREQGTLSFEGEGEVYGYETYAELPWAKYYDDIRETVLPEGIKLKLWMMGYDYADRAGRLGDMESLFVPSEDTIEEWMIAEDLSDERFLEGTAASSTDENGSAWYGGNQNELDQTVEGISSINRHSGTYSSGYYNTDKTGAGSFDGGSESFLTGKSSGTDSSYYNRYNNTYDVSDKYKDSENGSTTTTMNDEKTGNLQSEEKSQNGSADSSKGSQDSEAGTSTEGNNLSNITEETPKREYLSEDSSKESTMGEGNRIEESTSDNSEKEWNNEKNASILKTQNEPTDERVEYKNEEGVLNE